MDYEKKLREYIDLILNNPCYQLEAKEWAYGATDFAYGSGLINWEVRNKLQTDYKLLN